MSIFRDFFNVKQSPIFTGYRFGFGGGGSADAGDGDGGTQVSGGDVEYTYNGKKFHIFTSSGSLTVDSSDSTVEIQYVLIGGGGGTAGDAGGGGGAGGVISSIPGIMPTQRTQLNMDSGESVTVTIGSGGPPGGAGQPDSPNYPGGQENGNGYDTFFAGPGGNSVRALGGGAGGAEGNTGPTNLPVPASSGGQGGSGGGGRAGRNEASPTPGIDNQGNTGSEAAGSPAYPPGIAGGGGGGAGASVSINVDGGIGIQLPSDFRNPTAPSAVKGDPAPGAPSPGGWYFAAGGGGYTDSNYPIPTARGGPLGKGGFGGGGQGNETRDPTHNATNGQANTGSGGGGGGGSGGSGIAFFYYPA